MDRPASGRAARFDRGLWAVLAFALALRVAAVVWLSDTIPYSDSFYYHEAGRLAARDPGFFFRHETLQRYPELDRWPPGYPMFLATLYAFTGPHFRFALFVQAFLGTLACGLAFAIGKRAGGRRVGLLAAFLLAIDPTWVFATNLVVSENLFAPLLALGLWFASRARANATTPPDGVQKPAPLARHAATLCGVVLAGATLVRAIGLVVPLAVCLWMRSRRDAIRLLLGFAAGLAPWTVRNAVVAGSPALVCFGSGLNFYIGNNDMPPDRTDIRRTPLAKLRSPAAMDREGWRLGLRHVASHPAGLPAREARKLGALFASDAPLLHSNSAILLPDARSDPSLAPVAAAKRARQAVKDRWLHGPFAVLAAFHTWILIAGTLLAIVLRWKRLPDEMRLATWVLAAFVGAHLIFWAQPRFRYPLDLPMALLTAWAVGSRAGLFQRGQET